MCRIEKLLGNAVDNAVVAEEYLPDKNDGCDGTIIGLRRKLLNKLFPGSPVLRSSAISSASTTASGTEITANVSVFFDAEMKASFVRTLS